MLKGLQNLFDVVSDKNLVEKYKREHSNSILILPYTGEKGKRESEARKARDKEAAIGGAIGG